jgi:DNA (cytosine-5)-methyltransferase 1
MLHRARNLSPLNVKRIRATPEGGSWKDWDDSLVLKCHKKESGQTYKSVYGRMKWDDVSPTLTTQCTGYGNGRYGHPEQDRAISLREAAILQSFPKHYEFINPKEKFYPTVIEQHIGNAVPVRLSAVIAKSVKKHLSTLSK